MTEPIEATVTLNQIDDELDCMDALRQIMLCFDDLTDEQKNRVCNWFYDRYRVKVEL